MDLKRAIRIGLAKLRIALNDFLPDRCAYCHGVKGGVRGNENRTVNEYGAEVPMCDYCSVEHRIEP